MLLVLNQFILINVITLNVGEARFLFCWAKVLGPTIFGSNNVKLLMFELLLALLSEQFLAHYSSQHRRFYNVGS